MSKGRSLFEIVYKILIINQLYEWGLLTRGIGTTFQAVSKLKVTELSLNIACAQS